MKRFFRIFDLSKSEQRVVLIVVLVLLTVAFIGYERRVHHTPFRPSSQTDAKSSPTPPEMEDER